MPRIEVVCLSVRQPYAWAIVQGFKPVENRELTFSRAHIGPFLVHASKGGTVKEYVQALERIRKANPNLQVPPSDKLHRGGIVGRACVDRYVTDCDSPWFDGKLGVILSQAKPLPFLKMSGALGWFRCPAELVEQLKKLTRAAPPRSTAPAGVEQYPDAF